MKTVARRQGVKSSGGTFLRVRAAPLGLCPTVRRVRSLSDAVALHSLPERRSSGPSCGAAASFGHVPSRVTTVPGPLSGSSWTTHGIRITTRHQALGPSTPRQRHGSRCGITGLGVIAEAMRSGFVPGTSHDRVPGPAAGHPWSTRAGESRNWGHDEPVPPCDCDLRFSFP